MPVKGNTVEKNIFQGAIVITFVSILAKLASFIAEAVLAAYLGTTFQSDAFYMVSSIQQVIYPMLGVGIWKVFLPIYKEKVAKEDDEQASSIANKVTTLFTIASIIVTFFVFFFSDLVVGIVAPGFSGETKVLCSQLVKISSPMYIFIVAAAVYSSMLQCHNKFFGSQIREVASHIPTIIAAIFFYKSFGVQGLAVSLVVAGILRLLVELPFVDWGYKYKPDFNFKDRELIIVLKRLPSALISEGVNQFNTLVDKIMGSALPVGAISSLNYGNKLTNVFSGLFSTAIATALYPQVVELIALDKKKQLNILMSKIINIFALIMIPISFACVLYCKPLVQVVYQRGAFDAQSAALTAGIFACYSARLFFLGCNTVLLNVFYAYGDTKTPMYIALTNLGANVVGNIIFIKLWGAPGLALSTTTSAIAVFFLRLVLIRKYVHLNKKMIINTMSKVIIISLIACGIPFIIFNIVHVNAYLELLCSGIIGAILYFILAFIFKISELKDLMKIVKKKAKK